MYSFRRPKQASFEDINGDIRTVGTNIPRLEYKDGYLWGIKFGDQDSMSIPLFPNNNEWNAHSGIGTLVVTANAPLGYSFLRCGTVEVEGHGTLKTTIHNVNPEHMDNVVELFEDSPEFMDEEGHVLIVKYYREEVDFSQHTEFEAMEELNLFVHGDWH